MVYDIVNSVIYIILARVFCSTFLSKEAKHTVASRSLFTVLWFLIVIGASFFLEGSLAIRVVIAIVINVVFVFIIYEKNSIMKSVAVAALIYIIVMTSDMLVMAIHKYIDPDLKVAEIMESDISVYMGAVSQFIQIIIVFVIRRVFREVKEAEIKSKLWLVYLIFPMYSLSLIVAIVYSFDGPISKIQANVFTYIAISLLLINLFIYWFIRQESQRNMEYQKNALEIVHAKEIAKLYDQITSERDILGKREHEFKNVISVLQGLYSQKDYEKMKEILDVQNTELINNTNIFETGNRLVNTILNTKYAEAREKGISVRFVLDDLSNLKLEDRDLIVLLSNILNNAIEAAEKCPANNRLIKLKAAIEENQFVFAVRNTYINDIDSNEISSKHDVVSHGYGKENVKEVARRNGGNCFFEKKGNEYVSVVIIPEKSTKLA